MIPRSRKLRVVLLLLSATGAVWAALASFTELPVGPVRAAVRDYMAILRVERHADALREIGRAHV